MNLSPYILVAMLALSHLSARASAVTEMLPKDDQTVEVLDLRADSDLKPIMLKFQRHVQQNQVWFQKYVKENTKPGKPIPYHPNLGISRKEYDEMSAGMNGGGLKLAKIRDAKILVTYDKDGRAAIKVPGLTLLADGFSLNPATREATLAGLQLDSPTYYDNNQPGPVPPNAGMSWKKNSFSSLDQQRIANLTEIEKVSGRMAQVTLSKITGTEKCLLTVDLQSMEGGRRDRTSEYLRYPCR